MNEPKIITDFPGQAVEAFRNRHGGALPGELQACPHCGFDESSYSKERHLHIVVCQHCGSRSPATATQDGARTVWNARVVTEELSHPDAARMDWLEDQHVEVRVPLVYGSRSRFHASPLQGDGSEDPSNIREQIDAAMKQDQQELRDFDTKARSPQLRTTGLHAHVESEPKSWRLIPEEPSHAMLDALENTAGAFAAFDAMLAAAPPPPPTPLTDALIADLDMEPESRLVFVIRKIVNHAKDLERKLDVQSPPQSSATQK